MIKWILPIAMLLILVAGDDVYAQGRHAVSALPGYTCMRLNVAPGVLYQHRDLMVPVLASPSPSAPVLGTAIGVMVVPAPQEPRGGFFQVLRPDRSIGWIEAKYLTPWSNPYAPKARCEPAVMSDGAIGTRTVN